MGCRSPYGGWGGPAAPMVPPGPPGNQRCTLHVGGNDEHSSWFSDEDAAALSGAQSPGGRRAEWYHTRACPGRGRPWVGWWGVRSGLQSLALSFSSGLEGLKGPGISAPLLSPCPPEGDPGTDSSPRSCSLDAA